MRIQCRNEDDLMAIKAARKLVDMHSPSEDPTCSSRRSSQASLFSMVRQSGFSSMKCSDPSSRSRFRATKLPNESLRSVVLTLHHGETLLLNPTSTVDAWVASESQHRRGESLKDIVLVPVDAAQVGRHDDQAPQHPRHPLLRLARPLEQPREKAPCASISRSTEHSSNLSDTSADWAVW
jgi:hypothetical protein